MTETREGTFIRAVAFEEGSTGHHRLAVGAVVVNGREYLAGGLGKVRTELHDLASRGYWLAQTFEHVDIRVRASRGEWRCIAGGERRLTTMGTVPVTYAVVIDLLDPDIGKMIRRLIRRGIDRGWSRVRPDMAEVGK